MAIVGNYNMWWGADSMIGVWGAVGILGLFFPSDSGFYQIEHFKAQVRQDKTKPKCNFKVFLVISYAN